MDSLWCWQPIGHGFAHGLALKKERRRRLEKAAKVGLSLFEYDAHLMDQTLQDCAEMMDRTMREPDPFLAAIIERGSIRYG